MTQDDEKAEGAVEYEPSDQAKSWMLRKLAEFVQAGCGSFRTMIYDYLDMDYATAYAAGGMEVSNALVSPEDDKIMEEECASMQDKVVRLARLVKEKDAALREVAEALDDDGLSAGPDFGAVLSKARAALRAGEATQ